jgi:hypothetical protein
MNEKQMHNPGPWKLVWWGNEQYPYPLSVLADNDGAWIARDGTVSSEANARLIAAAPDMLAALDPDTLEAIANEIGGEFKHSARADSLRVIAKQQRAALAKATGGN